MLRFSLYESTTKKYHVHYKHKKKHKVHEVEAKSSAGAIGLFRGYWGSNMSGPCPSVDSCHPAGDCPSNSGSGVSAGGAAAGGGSPGA